MVMNTFVFENGGMGVSIWGPNAAHLWPPLQDVFDISFKISNNNAEKTLGGGGGGAEEVQIGSNSIVHNNGQH